MINIINSYDIRKLAEWYAHPASEVWKKEIYPNAKEKILQAFKASTNNESRSNIQGALCLLDELNEHFESARKTWDAIEQKRKGKVEREV